MCIYIYVYIYIYIHFLGEACFVNVKHHQASGDSRLTLPLNFNFPCCDFLMPSYPSGLRAAIRVSKEVCLDLFSVNCLENPFDLGTYICFPCIAAWGEESYKRGIVNKQRYSRVRVALTMTDAHLKYTRMVSILTADHVAPDHELPRHLMRSYPLNFENSRKDCVCVYFC